MREFSLKVAETVLPIPCFFPSISSVKTNLRPVDYLRVLVATNYPVYLVSAYDIHHAQPEDRAAMETLLSAPRSGNAVVLMDSGNYEAFWLRDSSWSAESFASVLRKQRFHLAFCFDNHRPPAGADAVVDDIERAVLRDQESCAQGTVVPIIHAPSDILPEVSRKIAEKLRPLLIAVPERALGDGVLKRGETVSKIRAALDEVEYYCPLHLLGTGHPLSILIYAMCGADSFDGLEWCQTVVDRATGRLSHFHQYEFFADEIALGKFADLPYALKVLIHNLLYYRKWVDAVRDALIGGSALQLAASHLPGTIVESLPIASRGTS